MLARTMKKWPEVAPVSDQIIGNKERYRASSFNNKNGADIGAIAGGKI